MYTYVHVHLISEKCASACSDSTRQYVICVIISIRPAFSNLGQAVVADDCMPQPAFFLPASYLLTLVDHCLQRSCLKN